LTPGGKEPSALGNVRKLKIEGSTLLSRATVVIPLSVKTRWKRFAGVRAA
jgi:hypothetical protein